MDPSVTIKGGILPKATPTPFNTPTTRPAKIGSTIGMISGYSPGCAKLAAITPASATIEPTDRSIPLEMITNIMPVARMPLMEACFNILIRFAGLAKAFGERIIRITSTRMKAINIPNSRMD